MPDEQANPYAAPGAESEVGAPAESAPADRLVRSEANVKAVAVLAGGLGILSLAIAVFALLVLPDQRLGALIWLVVAVTLIVAAADLRRLRVRGRRLFTGCLGALGFFVSIALVQTGRAIWVAIPAISLVPVFVLWTRGARRVLAPGYAEVLARSPGLVVKPARWGWWVLLAPAVVLVLTIAGFVVLQLRQRAG